MKPPAAIGNCSLCGQGRVLVLREDSTGAIYVGCEECGSEWDSPEAAGNPELATQGLHKRSTVVERGSLAGHSWARFLM